MEEFDVIVVGSGAGGLATAVSSALRGLRVIILEKAEVLGGTTAYAGGVVWIPSDGSPAQNQAALTYISANAGNYFDRPRAEAFVKRAQEAITSLTTAIGLPYTRWWIPDYYQDLPGASTTSRSFAGGSFNGRLLGRKLALIRPPLETFTLFGGMMIPVNKMKDFQNAGKSFGAFRTVATTVARFFWDKLTVGRATLLTGGNALVGALTKTALDHGVEIRVGAGVRSLVTDDGRVVGVLADGPGGPVTIHARHAVTLACGGFPHDPQRRQTVYPFRSAEKGHRSVAPVGNVGDGLRLGESVGADVVRDLNHPAAWTPASVVPMKDGRTVLFPHFVDRGKPGSIIVDRRGKRFVNESISYMRVGAAMIEHCRDDERIEAYMIADHKMIRRDGLGMVPPAPMSLEGHVTSGYLKRADTISELAQLLGIPVDGLVSTVETFNRHAAHGEDPEFHRGSDAYQLAFGTPGHSPNPCVAPIATGPFYALRLEASDLGTFVGLRADEHARVLSTEEVPIPGLYVVGNDMASTFGGTYPAAGITIGPALTFGFLAAEHIASVAGSKEFLKSNTKS